MLFAILAKVLCGLGCVFCYLRAYGRFAIQHAKGIFAQSFKTGGAKTIRVSAKIFNKCFSVFGTAAGTAHGIYVKHHVIKSQFLEHAVCKGDDRCIRRRGFGAEQLCSKLEKLSASACLGLFVAEEIGKIIQL